ncbi:hypothetical protein HYPSUDRAFT_207454 [Hypholoma sublateritium FD-334 SS-4]|uniref:Uncharacterized protein n=1 Tax=Hypholoma sublateritium (strain FD-334 SS-4) TaxID=945553 RepID=A0A0D2N9Z4_HYPSF|nr:hypothetical protein HYPSUDRAFT_207454 [Hypholoma sublateritium FD-334 SS-4]
MTTDGTPAPRGLSRTQHPRSRWQGPPAPSIVPSPTRKFDPFGRPIRLPAPAPKRPPPPQPQPPPPPPPPQSTTTTTTNTPHIVHRPKGHTKPTAHAAMFQDFHYPFSLPIPPRWKLIHGCLRTATVRLLTNSEDGLVPQAWRAWGPPMRRHTILPPSPPAAPSREVPQAKRIEAPNRKGEPPAKEAAPMMKVEVEAKAAARAPAAAAV